MLPVFPLCNQANPRPQGAGETLRGTVSFNADRRLRSSKMSEAEMAKHQEVIDAGRYEIENGKFAQRPQSWAVNGQPPLQEQQKSGEGRMGKWIHKATSHPSEKRKGGDLREGMVEKGKLRRRGSGGKLRVVNE
jgi:hypothetical protein